MKKTTGLLVCVVGIAALASCLRTSQNALSSSGLDDDAGIDGAIGDVQLGAVPAEHVWSYGFGSVDNDYDDATAVIALADGSVVVGGTIDTSYDDTGASTINVGGADLPAASAGETGFLARIDATGAVVWSRSFAGTGYSTVNALALAPDGSIVVLGTIGDSIDLGDGAVDGGDDGMGFILALTGDGTFGWSRLMVLGLSQMAIDGKWEHLRGRRIESGNLDDNRWHPARHQHLRRGRGGVRPTRNGHVGPHRRRWWSHAVPGRQH